MLFKKLFQLLVVGRAVTGTASACASRAEAQAAAPKRSAAQDAGGAMDAGPVAPESGGGVPGW